MFPASATNNVIQVKRSLSKPQPPGWSWSRGRMDGEGLLGVKTGNPRSEQMFSGLPRKRTSDLRINDTRPKRESITN
jgi:hypothetical protein